jgi:hypothetical protein
MKFLVTTKGVFIVCRKTGRRVFSIASKRPVFHAAAGPGSFRKLQWAYVSKGGNGQDLAS